MRRKVKIRTVSERNDALYVWIQHLVNRIIIDRLELPHRLKAKLLHETLPKSTRGEKNG